MEPETNATILESGSESIETWAYVEIFGHTQLAGRVSTRKLGTEVLIQIDVAKPDEGFSHSELYGPKAIFSMKPTTEKWCRDFARVREKHNYSVLPYIPTEKQLAAHEAGFDNEDDGEDPEY
jgi:hypothetical protein